MKKLFPFLSILLLGTKDMNAQIRFGGEKGVTLNNLSTNNFFGDYDMKVGFRTSFLADIPVFGRFSVQPAGGYTMKGAETFTTATAGNTTVDNKTKLILNYVEVPVHLVYRFGERDESHFFVGAGPYATRLISANIRQRTETNSPTGTSTIKENRGIILGNADNATDMTRTDFGISAMAGYQFGRRTYIKAGSTVGFRDLNTGGEIPFDGHNINFSLSIGRYMVRCQ